MCTETLRSEGGATPPTPAEAVVLSQHWPCLPLGGLLLLLPPRCCDQPPPPAAPPANKQARQPDTPPKADTASPPATRCNPRAAAISPRTLPPSPRPLAPAPRPPAQLHCPPLLQALALPPPPPAAEPRGEARGDRCALSTPTLGARGLSVSCSAATGGGCAGCGGAPSRLEHPPQLRVAALPLPRLPVLVVAVLLHPFVPGPVRQNPPPVLLRNGGHAGSRFQNREPRLGPSPAGRATPMQ